MPFLFESACWWTSALYPLPSSAQPLLVKVAASFIATRGGLAPHWLTAIHRPVELGLISLVRLFYFSRFPNYLLHPLVPSPLQHRFVALLDGEVPRETLKFALYKTLSFSFSPQPLPVTNSIIQSQPKERSIFSACDQLPKDFLNSPLFPPPGVLPTAT